MSELYEFLRSLWVVWLILIFLGIVAWAFWPGNRKRFKRDADIPFREDSED
jgi:cytochrome c oxidase cbb3-type subunit 4